MTISDELRGETRKPHLDSKIVELYRLVADANLTATTVFYLTNHTAEVTFDGQTYDPFSIKRGAFQNLGDGSIPTLSIGISNVTRFLTRYIEIGHGFRGREVTVKRASLAHLGVPAHAQTFVFKVSGVEANNEAVTFKLEAPVGNDLILPPDNALRVRCRRIYKSDACGYIGSLSSCLHTLTDCEIHGTDEENNARPNRHPLMFGGFPGMARRAR